MLYGEWELVGKEQVNYPNIEFLKDSSAVLHSQADTIYRFTFFIRNDTLVLVDINGNKHVNKICELNDKTVVLDGIADGAFIMDGGYKVLTKEDIIGILKESM